MAAPQPAIRACRDEIERQRPCRDRLCRDARGVLVQSALGGLPMAPCQTILVSNNSGERLGGLRSSRS